MMKKMYRATVACLLLMSPASLAHNRTLPESFVTTFPDAVADGILIDTPIAMVLWGLGMAPAVSIPLATVTATGGYTLRKTCNDYVNEQSDWKIAALCGFIGGATKYTSKAGMMGEFTRVEPFLGALDAASYEATSNVRGGYMTAEYMAIEGGVAALCYLLRPAGDTPTTLWKEVKIGLTIGAFVSGAVQTTYALYAPSVKVLVERSIKVTQAQYGQYAPGIKAWLEGWVEAWNGNAEESSTEKKEL